MIKKDDITGIILAGGKSSRMGSDKGFLNLNQKPFVEYSIEALEPLVSEIIIVADNKDYDSFGYRRVEDTIKDAGPVSGIYSGLTASKSEYNIVLSCDIPLITTEVLQKLVDAIDYSSEIIQIDSNQKSMPLIAIYKRSLKNRFLEFLEQDERRLRHVVRSCNSKQVVLEKDLEISTLNVNTKKDLKYIKNARNH